MDDTTQFKPPVGKAQEVGPGIRRVLAPNPSPMTFRGTNTYLVGTRDIAVIDPGPPEEAHLSAIMDALEGHQRISHIFVTTEVAGSDWVLRALHTPGHMGNHLSFELDIEGAFSGHVFCGDLVMGWSTSLVSPPDGHVSDFMASLQMMSERAGHAVYHAGHGAPVEDPAARMAELMAHRRLREGQILEALRARPMTAAQLAEAIYEDLNPQLLPAAARNVLAHLIDLTQRSAIRPDGPLSEQAVFSRQA